MAGTKKDKIEISASLVAVTEDIIRDGYLIYYISGKSVKDGPEEREAVQIFARMLVEDYGYPKEHIQTRPQHRVKVRPATRRKNTLSTLPFSQMARKMRMTFTSSSSAKRKTVRTERRNCRIICGSVRLVSASGSTGMSAFFSKRSKRAAKYYLKKSRTYLSSVSASKTLVCSSERTLNPLQI